MRAAARADDYNDIGGLRAWRLGAEYHHSDAVTLRASLSKGDGAPSMHHLHSTESQSHPYVLCIPASGPPPRTCDRINFRQVERRTSGNPALNPSDSKRHSIGFENRKGPFYFVVDWYRLTTSDLPGQHTATWAILNYPECPPGVDTDCIERTAGEITIHDSFANIVETKVSGVNARFGNRLDTDWGFVAFRGFWRYVAKSELQTATAKQAYPLPRNAVRIVNSVGRGNLTAFWALNYRDSFENLNGGQFGAWTGHDLTVRLETAVWARRHAPDRRRIQHYRRATLHEHRESLLERRTACGRLGTHFIRNSQHAVLKYWRKGCAWSASAGHKRIVTPPRHCRRLARLEG